MNTNMRIVQALLRHDLRAFVHKVFGTLTLGQIYVRSWHIDAIIYQLERIRRGEIRRLIINMPPRSLKSITASVAFPAFLLGHDPTRRVICVSYSGDLAKKHSNDFRAIVESGWYREIFPDTRIGLYKNTETEIELTARGFRLATSVGGTLTGRGGDTIIIDDPLKPDDAYSESRRTAANNWFANTLLSRLDDKRTGAIVVVMQRVHMDDLTGYLLGQSDEWELLSLPAIAYADEAIPIGGGRIYNRKAGEALSVREPLATLEAMKMEIGSDAFSAQYQQTPVPPGGMMVKREWVRRYSDLPAQSERLYVLQSWDTASKGGPDNDWSVGTTWIVAKGKRWYLVDVARFRADYPTLKSEVIRTAKKWKPRKILVEDKGTGTPLVDELKRQISGVVAVEPEGDKVRRMAVASAKIEAGQVFLPERAPWLADLEAELFAFPGSRHDDQCDSISQALMDKTWFWSMIPPEQMQKILEESARPMRRGALLRSRLL